MRAEFMYIHVQVGVYLCAFVSVDVHAWRLHWWKQTEVASGNHIFILVDG